MFRLSSCPKWSAGSWMTQEKLSGLVPFDLHVHDLDFLIYALGAPDDFRYFRSKLPEQDVFYADYRFGDVLIHCEASWYAARFPFYGGFRFQFERALLELKDGVLKLFTDDGRVLSSCEGGGIELRKEDPIEAELRYFKDCVREGRPAELITGEEAEAVIGLLERMSVTESI